MDQKTFTDEEIREHLDTIIGAAHDSSTQTMVFCLILIGSYPDVQGRIFKEYVSAFLLFCSSGLYHTLLAQCALYNDVPKSENSFLN